MKTILRLAGTETLEAQEPTKTTIRHSRLGLQTLRDAWQRMSVALLVLVMAFTARAQDANTITISTLDELKAFMVNVHSDNYMGKTVKLANHIDCLGGRFNTGDPVNPSTFVGTFDGQGYKIYNFVNTPTGSGDYGYGAAMFDYAEAGATIKDLTLEGTLPGTNSGAYSAAFVLAVESPIGLHMDNCHFNGSVTNGYHSAALVGFASPGADPSYKDATSVVLTKCTANATITTTGEFTVGGLVTKGTNVQAENCSFTGTISGKWTMGGLIGEAVNCSFTDCSFSGSMGAGPGASTSTLSNGGCGGLVGYSDGSVFTDCTSTVDISWDLTSDYNDGQGRTNSKNFIGEGGAAGVTLGASKFTNCSATGKLVAAHGYAGGFVGWTAGAETFMNCMTDVTINAAASHTSTIGNGGFAACVASNGATFKDCTTSSLGKDIYGGFYNVQHPKSDVTVGANTFHSCTVNNVSVFGEGNNANTGGFCVNTWNGTFTDCTVRGGEPEAGFVLIAGKKPNSDYDDVQTSTFTNCTVIGATVTTGFVRTTNPDNSSTNINTFSGCRAACAYDNLCNGSSYDGFAHILGNKTTVVDCAAYGAQAGGSDELYGFAYQIQPGATVSRCVGAVLPLASQTGGAGFAGMISYDTAVEDCYSVYAPTMAAQKNHQQGGFVLETSLGISSSQVSSSGSDKLERCFALGVIPESMLSGNGSFCGGTPVYPSGATYDVRFEDCYRPKESQIGDFNNQDHPGVGELTKAEFASATGATMPHYEFGTTWHAPQGVASSPYLNASTDSNDDFWTYTTVIGGKGHILINGEAPKEAYPAGARIKVKAVCDNDYMLFTGWVGEGFDDPTEQETWYTVKNVSAIAAMWTPADNINVTGNSVVAGEYWSTFYHPEADYQVGANEKAYIGTVNGNSVTLTEVTGGFIPAGNAVILKGASASFDLTRATTGDAFDFSGNSLLGGSTVADGKVAYTLAAKNGVIGFYKFVGTALNPNKAHLEIAPSSAPARNFFGFDIEGNETGIENVHCSMVNVQSDAWYTLDGRKLNGVPTSKGVFINNGRKVVIK